MKYYELIIYFDENKTTHETITDIIGVEPSTRYTDTYWCYQVKETQDEDNIHFIELFLNLLMPNFTILENQGVKKQDILFWLKYEYSEQCALGFDASDLKKLGDNGISLNIDCFEIVNMKS